MLCIDFKITSLIKSKKMLKNDFILDDTIIIINVSIENK